MKVFIISGTYYPNIFGGAEKVAQDLAEALVLRGHEVVVATLNLRRRHEVAEVNGVRVHYLPNQNIYFFGLPRRRSTAAKLAWHAMDTYNPLMAASLGHILEVERPDVVNTHNITGFSASVWRETKSRGFPLVHTAHDYYLLCPRGMIRRRRLCSSLCPACRVYSWPRRHVSGSVDKVIGVSGEALDKHRQHGCLTHCGRVIVYNACTMPHKAAAPLSDRGEIPCFGYLGRLHPSKGVHSLIRSFLELPAGSAELVIAGRGAADYERELRAMISGRQDARMLGFVAPREFFSVARISVVPSLWEDPAPLTVLESMSYGVPVIGSRRGGIPELMGQGTGWIFDPDQPGSLTRAMQRVIDSRGELAEMGQRAIQRAREFSIEVMVSGYLRVYERAIQENREGKRDQ